MACTQTMVAYVPVLFRPAPIYESSATHVYEGVATRGHPIILSSAVNQAESQQTTMSLSWRFDKSQ
jgi:hypothetical protein